MGVRASFSEIAFDILLPVSDAQALWERVARSAVNWAYTNWKGMSFGLLFAAAILNLLSNLSRKRFKNRWLNTLLGVFSGAPLGVCVNCATPIAQGMHASGVKLETSLATLISSPTLNIIVLSMSFTLLPLHLAIGKLVCVLILISLIPYFIQWSKIKTSEVTTDLKINVAQNLMLSSDKWLPAIKETTVEFFKNLIYIIKIALPLMLLAGVAGALVIEIFPFSNLNQIEASFINMLGLSLIGVFLPVPIAFDVLTAVALLSAGASSALVAVLVFSLGSFSIYPWLMISKNISIRLSLYITVAVILISLAFGLTIKYLNVYEAYDKQLLNHIESADIRSDDILIENASIVKNVCQALPFSLQSKCMLGYMLETDHYQQLKHQCDYLPDGFNISQCKSAINLNKLQVEGIAQKKPSVCQTLNDKRLMNQCLFEVTSMLAVKSYNINQCSDLRHSSLIKACRNRYLLQGIKFQVDNSVCNGIENAKESLVCKNNLIILSYVEHENIAGCNEFSDAGFRNHCTYSVASRIVGRSGDVSICDELTDSVAHKRCRALATVRDAKVQIKDDACYAITIADIKSNCIMSVAKLKIQMQLESLSIKYIADQSLSSSNQGSDAAYLSKDLAIEPSPQVVFESVDAGGEVEIKRSHFYGEKLTANIKFNKIEAVELGIDRSWKVKTLDFFDPFFIGKGIASGDFNNDHWPDLVLATESGVALYQNTGGKFRLIEFANSLKNENIFIVALIDLDGNGYQDIFASAYGGKNFIIQNQGYGFARSKLIEISGESKLTMAAGFSDMNDDNTLDIVFGNWSNGAEKYFNPEVSSNEIAYYINGKYNVEKLQESRGETLSVLLSDINNDTHTDMLFANDNLVPDMYYFSDADGNLNLISADDEVVAYTSRNTMSLESADFNNDLQLDIFSVDMNFSEGASSDYCNNVLPLSSRKECKQMTQVFESMKGRRISYCETIDNATDKYNCYATFSILASRTNQDDKYCQHLKLKLPAYYDLCTYLSTPAKPRERIDFSRHLPQKQSNVLLMSDGARFIDKAHDYAVDSSFWSWNSKAADLDNDQWLDIYVGNGYHFGDGFYEIHENVLFHNINGKRFEQAQNIWGLDSKINTPSYTYTDFDLDGDIDIIATSFLSSPVVYINQGTMNNSITIKLKDALTNTNAIGSRVSIYYGDNLKQLREIKMSGGFLSFDNPVAHFGLGDYEKLNKVVVRWPDGSETVVDKPLSANYTYVISRNAAQ